MMEGELRVPGGGISLRHNVSPTSHVQETDLPALLPQAQRRHIFHL